MLSSGLAVAECDMDRNAFKAVHAGENVVRLIGRIDEFDKKGGKAAFVRYRLLRRAAEVDLIGDDDIEKMAYDHPDDKEKDLFASEKKLKDTIVKLERQMRKAAQDLCCAFTQKL